MKRTPKLSVVLPVYREPLSYVESSVDSLRAQTFKDFECVVVLDDATNKPLKAYFTRLKAKDKRFSLLINESNVGLAQTLNRGIAQARAPFVARHDADDICLPTRFAKQLAYLKSHPNVDLLFGGITYIDERDAKKGTFIPQTQHVANIEKHIFDDLLLVHPTLMARTELMKRHPYDPSFRRSQDLELWLRLIGLANFAVLPEVVLLYRVPSANDADTRIDKVVTWSRSAGRALAKHRARYQSNPAYWRRRAVQVSP